MQIERADSPWRWSLWVGGIGAALVATGAALVLTPWGQRLDDAPSYHIFFAWPQSWEVNRRLGYVTPRLVAEVGAAAVLVALLRRRLDAALGAVVVLSGANLTTRVVKDWLGRPDLGIHNPGLGLENTMPSGHTTATMSFAVAALLVTPPALRGLVAVLAAVPAVFAATGMICVGAHRPGDIVGGVGVGLVWAAVGLAVTRAAGAVLPGRGRASAPREDLARRRSLVLAGCLLTGALTTARVVTYGVSVDGSLSHRIAGWGVIGGATVLTAVAVAAVARGFTEQLP